MRLFSKKSLLAAATACFSMSVWAVEPDELQGKVVSIDEESMSITVRVEEVGSELDTPVDSVQTYMISEDTNIVDDRATEVLPDDLDDIQVDEQVTFEFDTEDQERARTIIFYLSDL